MTRLLLLGVLLALALPAVAQAETVTVTSTADTNDGTCNAHFTLSEALILSSTEATIVVPAGTYTAETSSFGLNGNRAIVGAGAGATRLSGPGRRVLLVGPGTSSVTGVRISDGNSLSTGAGAGIHVGSGANFTLRDSLVDHNTAMLGGGIYSEGTLTVERSLIQANDAAATPASASRGGGLAVNGGTATITNTTFSDNSSDAFGGGIHVQAGSATLESVTVADNTATEGSAINQEGAGAVTAANTLVSGTAGNGCRLTPAGIAWSRGIVDGADASCGSGVTVLDDAGVSVLADNGGPTHSHALVPGSAAVDAGTGCPAEDQRGVARPQGPACDIGAYEAPAQGGGGDQPPPPSGDDEELPPPTAGKEVNAEVARGTVRVKLPGSSRFVDLTEPQQLPVGTIVDAKKGRVTLIAAGGQTATFYAGVFRIGQGKGARPLTTLTLVEKLSCPKAGRAIAAAKKKKRRLWGDGSGRFRTKGKHSAATVVGTKWLVEDRCKSTLTRVTRGRVSVRDFVKKKTVTVRAGKKYVARARR
jgi:predicted outer membrane repeat protein